MFEVYRTIDLWNMHSSLYDHLMESTVTDPSIWPSLRPVSWILFDHKNYHQTTESGPGLDRSSTFGNKLYSRTVILSHNAVCQADASTPLSPPPLPPQHLRAPSALLSPQHYLHSSQSKTRVFAISEKRSYERMEGPTDRPTVPDIEMREYT